MVEGVKHLEVLLKASCLLVNLLEEVALREEVHRPRGLNEVPRGEVEGVTEDHLIREALTMRSLHQEVTQEEGVVVEVVEGEQSTDRTITASKTQSLITERTSRVRATLGHEEGPMSRD